MCTSGSMLFFFHEKQGLTMNNAAKLHLRPGASFKRWPETNLSPPSIDDERPAGKRTCKQVNAWFSTMQLNVAVCTSGSMLFFSMKSRVWLWTTQPNFTCAQVPVSNVDLRQICPHLLLMTNGLLVKGHANRWMHDLALCILYHMLPSAMMNQGQGNERN